MIKNEIKVKNKRRIIDNFIFVIVKPLTKPNYF